MAGFTSRVADVLSAIKGSVIEPDTVNSGSVNTDDVTIDSTYRYAGSDAELNDALSESSDGDVIILGQNSFGSFTIDNEITIMGTGRVGSVIGSDWTLNERCEFRGVAVSNGVTVTVNERIDVFGSIGFASTTKWDVYSNRCIFTGIESSTIEFASGTQNSIVDSSALTTVTDNGSNTIGDIA